LAPSRLRVCATTICFTALFYFPSKSGCHSFLHVFPVRLFVKEFAFGCQDAHHTQGRNGCSKVDGLFSPQRVEAEHILALTRPRTGRLLTDPAPGPQDLNGSMRMFHFTERTYVCLVPGTKSHELGISPSSPYYYPAVHRPDTSEA